MVWLSSDPKTAEEVAENIYERIRAMGIALEIEYDEPDYLSLLGAYLARKGAQGEHTL